MSANSPPFLQISNSGGSSCRTCAPEIGDFAACRDTTRPDHPSSASRNALGETAQVCHRGDGRGRVVVRGDPLLAFGNHRVVDLAVARQRRERLLADVVPVDELQPRDADRFLGAREARNQIEREVVPRRAAAGEDQPLRIARDHERAVRVQPHRPDSASPSSRSRPSAS